MLTQLRGYDEDCHDETSAGAAQQRHMPAVAARDNGVQNVTLTDSHAIIGYPPWTWTGRRRRDGTALQKPGQRGRRTAPRPGGAWAFHPAAVSTAAGPSGPNL